MCYFLHRGRSVFSYAIAKAHPTAQHKGGGVTANSGNERGLSFADCLSMTRVTPRPAPNACCVHFLSHVTLRTIARVMFVLLQTLIFTTFC